MYTTDQIVLHCLSGSCLINQSHKKKSAWTCFGNFSNNVNGWLWLLFKLYWSTANVNAAAICILLGPLNFIEPFCHVYESSKPISLQILFTICLRHMHSAHPRRQMCACIKNKHSFTSYMRNIHGQFLINLRSFCIKFGCNKFWPIIRDFMVWKALK